MKDVGSRRAAREFSFQFLYQFHFQENFGNNIKEKEINWDQEIDLLAHAFEETSSVEIGTNARQFALSLLKAVIPRLEEIPEVVGPYLQNWKWDRLKKVDATILNLAVGELLYYKKTPAPVVIVEAIELAKKYGDKESPSFINAILDQLSKNPHD